MLEKEIQTTYVQIWNASCLTKSVLGLSATLGGKTSTHCV